jgi:Trypsin-like peptidase domain
MINPKTIIEKLLFSTVKINIGIDTGTGFFFDFKLSNQEIIHTIITNRHVVEGATEVTFWVHKGIKDAQQNYIPSGGFEELKLPLMPPENLIFHPNKTIDLCAIVIDTLLNTKQQQGINIFYYPLTEDFIPKEAELKELNAVEDIFMFGYPNGLWDYCNNLPLIRKGITSSHPAVDFCGYSQTVIDAACVTGSSGSPVLLIREETYKPTLGTFIRDSPILLGILAEGPLDTAKESPNNQLVSPNQLVMHLGYIFKAREINSLGNAVKEKWKDD